MILAYKEKCDHTISYRITGNSNYIEAVIENTSDFIIAIDNEHKIIFLNSSFKKAYELATGLTIVRGQNFLSAVTDFCNPGFTSKVCTFINNALSGTKSCSVNFTLKSPKLIIPLEVSTNSILNHGDTEGIIITAKDVTSRRKADKELRVRSKQLSKTNKELDSFIYRASHDLKGPVSSIMGLTNLAIIDFESPEVFQYLKLIKKTAEKLNNILLKMNIASSLKTDQLNLLPFNFNVFKVELIKKFSKKIKKKEIKVCFENNIKNNFYTDQNLIQLMIEHLFDNAVKFRRPEVECFVRIEFSEYLGNLIIKISDNGQGIDSQYHSRIFNMFFRANIHSKGLGLGLYIVQKIVQKLNGKITVNSKISEHTIFTITLPINQSPIVPYF